MQRWKTLSGGVENGSGVGGGSESPEYGGRWCGLGGKNAVLRTAAFCSTVPCVAVMLFEAVLVYSVGMHVRLPSDSGFWANPAFQMSCSVISSSHSFQCTALVRRKVELYSLQAAAQICLACDQFAVPHVENSTWLHLAYVCLSFFNSGVHQHLENGDGRLVGMCLSMANLIVQVIIATYVSSSDTFMMHASADIPLFCSWFVSVLVKAGQSTFLKLLCSMGADRWG